MNDQKHCIDSVDSSNEWTVDRLASLLFYFFLSLSFSQIIYLPIILTYHDLSSTTSNNKKMKYLAEQEYVHTKKVQ